MKFEYGRASHSTPNCVSGLAGGCAGGVAGGGQIPRRTPAGKAKAPSTAAASPAASQPVLSPGQAALRDYLAKYKTQVGLLAVRLDDGAVLASYHPADPMLPASVQKLLTSAVALAVLGNRFEFRTTLAVLGDDLVVVGDGDPTLGNPFGAEQAGGTIYDLPDAWAAKLKAAGLTAVKGNLWLDDSIFRGGRPAGWPREQLSTWYCTRWPG